MNLQETAPEQSTQSNHARLHVGIVWIHPVERLSPIPNGTTLLGRSDDAHIILTGDRASRRHASITRDGAHLVLRDEGSRNGTRCNGKPITETQLTENDVVRLGDWVGIIVKLPKPAGDTEELFSEPVPGVLVGPRTRPLWEQVLTVASSELPIVVEGETGTGKEVVAQAIHQLSGRAGDLVAVNCAALPEGLIEAQLFGHQKGAFTGAHQASLGYFGAAHKGTLFLDELLELPLPQQAKLLRAVEEGAVTAVGSTTPRKVETRIVAATQRPLWRLVEEKRFRADLQARLSGITLKLPPLRQRREEIPRLFQRVIQGSQLAQATQRSSFVEALCLHDWPLNVRELVQTAHRATVILQGVEELASRDFRSLAGVGSRPPGLSESSPPSYDQRSVPIRVQPTNARSEAERNLLGTRRYAWLQRNRRNLAALIEALARNSGNISRAAKEVGVSRQQAHRLLEVQALLKEQLDDC
jgi:DNA-binding NtrC family response regulator